MPEPTIDHGKTLISWKFPEYVEHKRSKAWYIIFFVIGIGAIVYSIFTQNILFIVIIIILWTTILISTRRKPQRLRVNITEDGLEIEDKFYEYDKFNNFWIIYNPPEVKYLYVSYKSSYRPDIVIPIERANPVKIREALIDNVPEDTSKEEESLNESFNRYYKI
ncbi:hypothetical protein KKG41_05030 [Patescibacteria group bacterium]|nr:hypothetical protein [Patescibacteria group bacterium]MBU1890534.1 hypothetical protein [Patescibacteria group bacterium]